jgi:hypothetical protein
MTVVAAVVAVLAATWGVRSVRRRLPAAWPRGPQPPIPPDVVPGDLEWVQRAVGGAPYAGEMHWRLRPILREVAASGLRRRGVDLDGDEEAARAVLAPVTWELVRADRPRPDDQFAPGLSRRELDVVLTDLEELLR